jgi:hypothetical protein
MSADHFCLCLHLDARGFPCNRRTMRPLSLCSLHRPKARGGTHAGPTPEYQRKRKARLALAGMAPEMEAA